MHLVSWHDAGPLLLHWFWLLPGWFLCTVTLASTARKCRSFFMHACSGCTTYLVDMMLISYHIRFLVASLMISVRCHWRQQLVSALPALCVHALDAPRILMWCWYAVACSNFGCVRYFLCAVTLASTDRKCRSFFMCACSGCTTYLDMMPVCCCLH